MNANQIINMIVRTVMRKVIRSGVDAVGARMKRGKPAKGNTPDPSKRLD